MQLVLDTHNISLRVRNRSFQVSAGKERRIISPHKLTSIAVISPCSLSSAAVLLAVAHKIPIIFFDHSGEPEAQVWSTQFGNMAELRRAQVLFGMSDEAPRWAAEVFRLKTEGQLANLRQADQDNRLLTAAVRQHLQKAIRAIEALLPTLTDAARQAEPFNALMLAEAQVARTYWSAWGSVQASAFRFANRSRRPAADAYNAALNYLYGMLYNAVEGAVLGAGMDPMFGIIHADEFGAPTLVFDLIEPFRPAADRLLTRLTSEGRIDLRHFETDASKPETGVSVSREGRKILIAAFNEHLREICTFNGQTGAFKQHLYQLAGALATSLKQFWEHDPAGKLRHRRRPPAAQSGE